MGRVIAITNQKGGVGKTTTAINLAAALALFKKNVLIIDCDPQGNASSGLGVRVNPSFYDVLTGKVSALEVIKSSPIEGLDCLCSQPDLSGIEVELASMPKKEHQIKSCIATLVPKYDYIFLDCPPSLGLLTINALTAADSVLIPIQCEYYALEGLAQLLKTIKLIKQRTNPLLKIEGFVLTMFDRRNSLSFQIEKEVRRHFENYTYKTIIPRNVRLSEAPSYGIPIFLYDEKCKGAQSYRNLALEFLKKVRS